MQSFDSFFLMTPADVRRYAIEVLHQFQPDEPTTCTEIGDGNINYVFRIRSQKDGHSLVVKQADRLLRSSGRPLDTYRNKIEAHILQLEERLAPGMVPHVYHYNETMCALAMEDISAYCNLRKALMENRVYPHLADNISTFLADTLLPTTDLVLDRAEKKQRVKFFINPELCDITEDLVLTEPFYNYKNRNLIFPGNEDFVEKALYSNPTLHAEVAKLRNNFLNNAQALIHGDLHSGSIFVNEHGIKVIDPEFAFYGPMGYDIGNVIGNLFFAWANKVFTAPAQKTAITALQHTIAQLYDLTAAKLGAKFDACVTLPLYRAPGFRDDYLRTVIADSLGYAGTEIIRRTVGDSKVLEITSVTDPALRIPMERALIQLGIRLILERCNLTTGSAVTDAFRTILSENNMK